MYTEDSLPYPPSDDGNSGIDTSVRFQPVELESDRLESEARRCNDAATNAYTRANRTRETSNYLIPVIGKMLSTPYAELQRRSGDKRSSKAKQLQEEAGWFRDVVKGAEDYLLNF